MSDKKTHVVSIRISESMKATLEEKAEEHVMELSQYVKYVLLNSIEQEGILNTRRYKCLDWLEENYRLIGRMIIEGYFKTDALTKEKFDEEYIATIKELSHKIFKKQGISKKEGEQYY